MEYILWLILGLILGSILIFYARLGSKIKEKRTLSNGLIVAALFYVAFAFAWGNWSWILIELMGVPFYGFFVWLSTKRSYYWLAAGWLIHPAWDALIHLWGAGQTIAPEWFVVACISFDPLIAGYIWLSEK